MVDKRARKIFAFGLIGIFLLMFVSSFVLADSAEDTGYILGGELRDFAQGIMGFFTGAFEGTEMALEGTALLTTFLFAALLYMIIFSILDSTFFKSYQPWIKRGISLAITLLALVGLPPGWLQSISVAYGAMGASILVVIPFLIVTAFSLKVNNQWAGKLTWIAFAFYFLGIFIYRALLEKTFWSPENVPNFVGFLIGVVAFIFLPYFRNIFFRGDLAGKIEKAKDKIKVKEALDDIEMRKAKREGLVDDIEGP